MKSQRFPVRRIQRSQYPVVLARFPATAASRHEVAVSICSFRSRHGDGYHGEEEMKSVTTVVFVIRRRGLDAAQKGAIIIGGRLMFPAFEPISRKR